MIDNYTGFITQNKINIKNETEINLKNKNPFLFFKKINLDNHRTDCLSEKYGINLDKPSRFTDNAEFFEKRDLVSAIDHLIKRLSSTHKEETVSIVRQTLLISHHQAMMSELGMILFYLDRDRVLPQADQFVDFRAREMLQIMQCLMMQHSQSGASSMIPTGKTHYILHAFAQMVITSEQTYNTGGICAIKELLTNPEYHIALHLQPEHQQHILTVAGSLHSESKSISSLLQTKVKVHPDLQDIIRLDLKLSPSEAITPICMIHDSLSALFADARQNDSPNCYSIASVIYVTESDPYAFLSKTFEWLQRGCLPLDDQLVPIMPLVTKRLSKNEDLNGLISSYHIAPIDQISEALSLSVLPNQPRQPITIREALSQLIEVNNNNQHELYAQQLFHSYKSSLITILHVAAYEMTSFNLPSEYSKQFSSAKRDFLDICIKAIYSSAKKSYISKYIANELYKTLSEKLWLNESDEKIVAIQKNTLNTSRRSIRGPSENIRRISKIFDESLDVLELTNEGYQQIDSVTQLQGALQDAVVLTEDNMRRARPEIQHRRLRRTASLIRKAVSEDRFRIHFTNECSRQIDGEVNGKDLNRANILKLYNRGGDAVKILNYVYHISLSNNKLPCGRTPYQLTRHLFEWFDDRINGDNLNFSRKLLIRNQDHIWTLDPYPWKKLLNIQTSYDEFIQNSIFIPVNQWLEEPVRQEFIDEVIDRYCTNFFEYDSVDSLSKVETTVTNRKFIQGFLRTLDPNSRSYGEDVIQEVCSSVALSKLSLTRILQYLNIEVSSPIFYVIYDSLAKEYTHPYIIARKLRELLMITKAAIIHPYDIEAAICRAANTPMSFPIGDSNWNGDHTEAPFHLEFAIRYNYLRNTLCVVKRGPFREYVESDSEYRQLDLFYH